MIESNSNALWGGDHGCVNLAPRSWRDEQDGVTKVPGKNDALKRNNQSIENIRKIGQALLNRNSNDDVEKSSKDEIKKSSNESKRMIARLSIDDMNKARAMFTLLTHGGGSNKKLESTQTANDSSSSRDFFTLRRNGTNSNRYASETLAKQKGNTLRKSESGSILRSGRYSNPNLGVCVSKSHLDMRHKSRSQVHFSASPCVYHYQPSHNNKRLR